MGELVFAIVPYVKYTQFIAQKFVHFPLNVPYLFSKGRLYFNEDKDECVRADDTDCKVRGDLAHSLPSASSSNDHKTPFMMADHNGDDIECRGRVDGQYENPDICHSYFLCKEGKLQIKYCNLHLMEKLPGCPEQQMLIFDKHQGGCVRADQTEVK